MADLIANGTVRNIWPTVSVGTQGFEKREFSIQTDEQYPQTIMFELQKDRVDMIDPFKIGEKIAVHFNLRGREWVNPQGETKVFNTLQAWKLAHAGPAPQQQPAAQQPAQQTPPPPAANAPAPPPGPGAGQPVKKSTMEIEAERIGYVHTNTQFSLDVMIANKWTFDSLVAHGHGKMAEDLPF